MTGVLPRLWRQPSAVLLAVQLVGVLLYPFMDESAIGRAALSLFALVVLFLAVRAVRATPALLWVSVLLGVPIVVLTILEVADPLNNQVVLGSSVLHAVFYFYTAFALLRYMFLDRFVTTDELWATGATFTVVAWGFAYTFMAVQVIWPGSFSAAIDPLGQRTWFEMLFLSFTNLTSVGLSDITPVMPHARSWVMIEQVAGLMYVALVISRIVGLTIARQRASWSPMFHLTEAIRIERPAAEAWAMLIDFPNIPRWESGVLEVRQTSAGAAAVGTTLVARRVYGGRETNVDCRILDWQADRLVTMEILGGPTRRAVATYEVEPIGDDACRVTYTVDGEMRRGLGWLTPVIPRVGRRLVKTNLVSLGRRLADAASAAAGARAAGVSPPDPASAPPS